MTTFTSEDREMAAKHDGIEVCNDKQIAEMDVNHLVEYLNGWYSTAAPRKAATMLRQQQAEIELLETEIFVKDAIIKCYKEALEQIATGEIAGESTNYKNTVYVMRNIALDALAILRKAQE